MCKMETRETTQGSTAGTRLIPRGSTDFLEAIHLALGVPYRTPDAPHTTVTEFLDDADLRSLKIDPVAGTFADGRLIAASAGVESPGSAALVLVPTETTDAANVARFAPSVKSVCDHLRERDVSLTELLAPAGENPWSTVARDAGLCYLTDLIYLVRGAGYDTGPGDVRRDVDWTPLTRDAQTLFEETLSSTYEDSADCPELCGMRTPKEVLAGHRAAGGFDGALWSVVSHQGKPAGILLLARLPRHNALELVYMGVSKDARKKGFADTLLRRAVDTMQLESANTLALAVDIRNAQARCVYERWGFSESGRRSAWITNPDNTIACEQPPD
jgi:GNAT superfamily N-acetyltransferase